MDGASDAPTSSTKEARKIPEILVDEHGEPMVKQESLDEETSSLQSVKKSATVKRQIIVRCLIKKTSTLEPNQTSTKKKLPNMAQTLKETETNPSQRRRIRPKSQLLIF